MAKRHLIFLAFAFLSLPGRAAATATIACPAAQPVYVSSGSQIFCVETASSGFGTRTALIPTPDTSILFEDLVFGPDGNLYATDSLGNKVFRFDPSVASTLTPVATLPSNATPAGLAFSGSDGDLYVITNIGVFRLQRVASLFSPLVTLPVTLSTADISLSITAGGAAFGETGTLLIVNQSGNGTVLSADPVIGSSNPYPSITNSSLITNFFSSSRTQSPAIAGNTCGDILVATANVIKRFGADGTLLNSAFATLGNRSANSVQHMEVDANNVLWAATNNPAGSDTGILWRINPVVPSGGDPITSCASGTATQVGTSITGGASGLALPPTSHSITHAFGGGTSDTCPPSGFDSSDTTKTYLYGHHSWTVTYKNGISRCFPQTFTARRVRPFDAAFCTSTTPCISPPNTFEAGTRCALYPSLGGFCVQYTDDAPVPVSNTQNSSNFDYFNGIRIKVGFFNPLGLFLNPGLADCPDTFPNTGTNACNKDISHDFYPAAGPGTDPTDAGEVPVWGSRFVVFNEPLNATFLQPTTLTIHSPVSSCRPLPCNPRFNFGQNVRVSFTLVDANGNPIPNAFERLSVLRTSYTPTFTGGPPQIHAEPTVPTNHSNVDNIFNTGSGGLYVYNLDSSFFQALPRGTVAIYQLAIFGNGHQIDSSTVLSVTVTF